MSNDLVKLLLGEGDAHFRGVVRDRRTIGSILIQAGEHIELNTETIKRLAATNEELEGKRAKAIHALRITDKWLVELGMYANPDYHLVPSLQHVRDTLKELDK